ncbi:IPT/TIG domain-containing protein [Xanthomonas euroxanthea]|uniref:IPT/TIG domain-containing protein n=1 Tax=Xanthomonas euroxanthea TaxID=2259622 RepID=UPI00161D1962|nr:IPT/TIG domain-containing protein [Xanthomonas euroxanthea]MBB5766501.1 YD repeat-containing protein [Xanthomonas euroxanthea]
MEVPQRGVRLHLGRSLGFLSQPLSSCFQKVERVLPSSLRAIIFFTLLLCTCAALATSFVYDSNGRLVAVTNDAGAAARYQYDKLGNITKIERFQAGDLAIFDFSPRHGGPGDLVRISGQGFSATASQNAVTFNGVASSVSAASTSSLTVAVPNGATTGPLSVTVGTKSARTTDNFTVDAQGRLPQISSITPRIASAGTAITVVGKSLQPIVGQTSTRLGLRPVVLSQVSNTQLVFPVPASAGSGKVYVTTPYGTATSADDLVVVPADIDAAEVKGAIRLAVDGGAQNISTTTTGQRTAVLFDSRGDDYLSAQFSAIGAGTVDYALYGMDNKRLAWGTASASTPSFHMPKLKGAGTHLLVLTAKSAPLSLNLQIERAATLALDGALQSVVTTIAGQSKRLLLDAQSNVPLGLGLAETANPVVWDTATVNVYGPDGGQVAFQQCAQKNNGCSLNVSGLQTGRHTVLVTPAAAGTRLLGFQTALSTDKQATLTRDTAYALALGRPGQNGRLLFSGAAGETLGLLVSGQATTPVGRTAYYRIYSPDGALWKSVAAITGVAMNLSLPAAGQYQIFVDAEFGETLHAQVKLSTGTTGLVLDGASQNFLTTLPGEGIYFTITAGAGKSLGLGISGLTITNGTTAAINVYKPDGNLLANTACYAANDGCDVNLPNLGAGVHGVEILPMAGEQTMRFNATVSSDLLIAMGRNVATPLAITKRGQNARLGFTATAGEVIALKITGQTATPAGRGVYYRAYQPSGASIASGYASSEKTLLIDAPVAGNYQVLVDPEYGATASASLMLQAGVLGEMEPDGSIGQYQTVAGASVSFTISASAGNHLGFGLSHLEVSAGTYVRINAYAPSGSSLGNDTYCYVANGGCDIDLYNPVAGSYSIVVTPATASQTMKFRATQSSIFTAGLSRNNPLTMSLDRRGQDALMTFNGTKGETVALQVAGQSTVPAGKSVRYEVYKPSERRRGYYIDLITPETGGAMNLSLPETGTYWVLADPDYGAATTAQVTLSTGNTSGMVNDGVAAEFAGSQPGQTAHYRIEATAGQHLGFAVSDLMLTSGTYVRIYAYAPNGASLGNDTYCYVVNGGCDIDIYNPVAGTYSVLVVPSSTEQKMQFKTTLSSSAQSVLSPDVPSMLSLNRRGQDALMTFNGTKGETVALQVAGQSTVPAGKSVRYEVYKPSERRRGYYIDLITPETGGAMNLSLPETGTYWVVADPDYGAATTAQVTLSTGTSSGLRQDGTPTSVETALPGQTAFFRINATAGQHLGFGLSDLVLSSGTYVRIYAYAPDGSGLGDETYCYVANGGCDIDIYNPVTGTYSVLVIPAGLEQAMQFTATLSSSITASLVRDKPLVLELKRRGQDALMTFSGTKGEALALQAAGQSAFPAGKSVGYRVYKPSDRRIGYNIDILTVESGGASNLVLPETGIYWVSANPEFGATAVAQVTLSTGTTSGIVQDGAAAQFTAALPAQPAHFRFETTAGQHLGFAVSDLAVSNGTYVRIYAYSPSGTSLGNESYCYVANGGCDVDFYNPVAGNYSVLVVPSVEGQKMQFKATLSSGISAVLSRGTPLALSLPRRGQDGLLTFSGTQGEKVVLQIAGQSSMPAGKTVRYRVYKPSDRRSGYQIASFSTVASGSVNVTLPEAGTYWIYANPEHGGTASANVTLSSAP